MLQAFKMMNSPPTVKLNIPNEAESLVPSDVFSRAIGSGYASMGGFLGISGNGGFKAPMKMELRDMLVAAAQESGIHHFAEYYIEDYEADDAVPNEPAEKETRRQYQRELGELWGQKIHAYHFDVTGGINGMNMYQSKFKYMLIDPEKLFKLELRDALGANPRNKYYPSVMKLDDHSRDTIELLTTEAYSSEFFLESPRTDQERMTYEQRNQLRLEYPPERAPVQYQLQKRTSELNLVTPPPVQNYTPLQLAADRVKEERVKNKSSSSKKFSVLHEAQVISIKLGYEERVKND